MSEPPKKPNIFSNIPESFIEIKAKITSTCRGTKFGKLGSALKISLPQLTFPSATCLASKILHAMSGPALPTCLPMLNCFRIGSGTIRSAWLLFGAPPPPPPPPPLSSLLPEAEEEAPLRSAADSRWRLRRSLSPISTRSGRKRYRPPCDENRRMQARGSRHTQPGASDE